MNKLYDVLRLVTTSTLSDRDIAAALQLSKNTVRRYRTLSTALGATWAELSTLAPADLERRFNRSAHRLNQKRQPDFAHVHQELQGKGVTLLLLWEDYRAANPDDALSYSQFTHHYREFRRSVALSMRQSHPPGARVFVDFSGMRPHYVDPRTGADIPAELFVGALGYSHLLYALAVPTQRLPDWIRCHVAMFEYFGGVPQAIVPDNLRAAVSRPGREPVLTKTYEDLAQHYGTTILPARSRHPRDKGKVEVAVQVAQRWILARLRHRTFLSLAELNQAIGDLLEDLNRRPFKSLPGCRRERFEQTERAALLPLPAQPYEFAEWSASQHVGPDYHVQVRGHWYSVPCRWVGFSVEARATATTIEIFQAHLRVASHARSDDAGGHTTDPNHMPEAHRAQAERTPERYLAWAEQIGPAVLAVVRHQFERQFPMLGLPACDVLRRLERQYGAERLEQAAQRALEIKSPTAKSVKSLLSSRVRTSGNADAPAQRTLPLHDNLRGATYYGKGGR